MVKKYLTKKALLAHLWSNHSKYYEFIPAFRATEELVKGMPEDFYDGWWMCTPKAAIAGLAMTLNGVKPDCDCIIVRNPKQRVAIICKDWEDDTPYRLVLPRQKDDKIFTTKDPNEIWTRLREEENN